MDRKRAIKTYEFLIFGYLATYLVHFFTDLSFNLTYVAWTFFGLLCGIYLLKNKKYGRIILFSLLIDFMAFCNSLINGGHSAFNAAILLNTQMFGLMLYDKRFNLKKVGLFSELFIYYLLIISFLTPKILTNASQGQYAVVLSILVGGNTISIFLILFLCINLFWRRNDKLPINYLPIIVSIIIAYHNGGNGGVVSLGALLIGIVVTDWNNKRISKKKTVILVFFGTVAIFCSGYQSIILRYLLDDNSRLWMWSRYYECAISSVKDFVFGANVGRISFLALQRNLHNTFFNWHYYYGLIPFVTFIFVFFRTVWLNIRYKDFFQLVILGTIFIRSMTDEATFCLMIVCTFVYLQSTVGYKDKKTITQTIKEQKLKRRIKCSIAKNV